ncbi:hypothetical protein HMPREF2951_04400 [Staphylococcus sp. HMSC056D08]|nr:hypothetical protein HMPREF2951_04400 [Staphylococcus sp. HMSC056D08]
MRKHQKHQPEKLLKNPNQKKSLNQNQMMRHQKQMNLINQKKNQTMRLKSPKIKLKILKLMTLLMIKMKLQMRKMNPKKIVIQTMRNPKTKLRKIQLNQMSLKKQIM